MSDNNTTNMDSNQPEKVKQIPNMFTNLNIPSVFQIGECKKDLPTKISPTKSINIDYPKFTLGFQHFVHAKKEQLDILNNFEGKKKVYDVVNTYSSHIDDYETNIEKIAKEYFDIGTKPDIINKDFYGFWELLCMFKLIPTKGKFQSMHMMDNGSNVQATLLFRDKYAGNDAKQDSYILYEKNNDDAHLEKINDKFMSYYKKEKPERLSVETKQPKKVDLVTLTLGDKWEYRNMKEQDSLKLLCTQLITGLESLGKGGNMICSIFENFTEVTNKIIYGISCSFKTTSIVKPLATNPLFDNKYIVFENYNEKSKINEHLHELVKLIDDKHFIVNIYPDLNLPEEFISIIRKANTDISNRQFINMNNVIEFINSENYYGDKYQEYRSEQIKATNTWVSKFFPDKKNLEANKKIEENNVIEVIETNKTRAGLVGEKLVSI